jgi:hypothetical protein
VVTEGNEGKWFRRGNVPGSFFGAELEGLSESRNMTVFARKLEVGKPAE